MSEHKWIPLEPNSIAPSIHPAEARWSVESPSPYDVPTHFRVGFDTATRQLVVEFRYIADEPRKLKSLSGYFQVEVGKRTGRIYVIRADVDEIQRRHSTINDETHHLIHDLPPSPNRDITIRAIGQQKTKMFACA